MDPNQQNQREGENGTGSQPTGEAAAGSDQHINIKVKSQV